MVNQTTGVPVHLHKCTITVCVMGTTFIYDALQSMPDLSKERKTFIYNCLQVGTVGS
jgi:hypothetical protein